MIEKTMQQTLEKTMKDLLGQQKTILQKLNLTNDEIKNFVFGEGDLLEQYLKENDITENSINLEKYRDMQYSIVNDLTIY